MKSINGNCTWKVFFLAFFLIGCGSIPVSNVQSAKDAEQQYLDAKRTDAINDYQNILINYPQSSYAHLAWEIVMSQKFKASLNKVTSSELQQLINALANVSAIKCNTGVRYIGKTDMAAKGIQQIISADEKGIIELTSPFGKVYTFGYGPYFIPGGSAGATPMGGIVETGYYDNKGRYVPGVKKTAPTGYYRPLSKEDLKKQGIEDLSFNLLLTPAWAVIGKKLYIYDGQGWFVSR